MGEVKHRRPAFVDQTIFYNPAEGSRKGNCTEAAVASILGLSLDDVPDFSANGDDALTFWNAFEDFINAHGFEVMMLDGSYVPDVLYLASGMSPRGVHHMVVMRAGQLVHDPHPSRAGIAAPEQIRLLVPIDPSAALHSTTADSKGKE
jgi:hypothetical protein